MFDAAIPFYCMHSPSSGQEMPPHAPSATNTCQSQPSPSIAPAAPKFLFPAPLLRLFAHECADTNADCEDLTVKLPTPVCGDDGQLFRSYSSSLGSSHDFFSCLFACSWPMMGKASIVLSSMVEAMVANVDRTGLPRWTVLPPRIAL
jgi:hypothetical protein